MRRAHSGFDEPVFYKGIETGTVRKYSDTLTIFLLKGFKPDKYKDRVANELSGPNGGAIEIDDSVAADKIAAIMAAAKDRRAKDGSDLA